MLAYDEFLEKKLQYVSPTGFSISPETTWKHLFPFQSDLVRWALRRGMCAIFAATGLGKTRMQLTWANEIANRTGGNVLILAPLAVASQTVHEGEQIGISATLCRESSDVTLGINVTNYDRLHKFNPKDFAAVVLDESSIIKHHDAKTFNLMVEAFGNTKYKLCATATPSPNDYTELGTHAEFLGICNREEMLAEYFVHDGGETQKWRLKKHAAKVFWKWVSGWGIMIRKPSDLGYEDTGYDLPQPKYFSHIIPASQKSLQDAGVLFAKEASGLLDRRRARSASLSDRVISCARIINESKEQWLVWCDLNAESEALTDSISDAIEIRGSDDSDVKEERIKAFISGQARVLVTKPSIVGFGLNFQHCHNMAFVGVTDSWESYFQAIRRCWRFGQTKTVNVHVFSSEVEGSVVANLKRKERDAECMADELSNHVRDAVMESVTGQKRQVNEYNQPMIQIPSWLISQ